MARDKTDVEGAAVRAPVALAMVAAVVVAVAEGAGRKVDAMAASSDEDCMVKVVALEEGMDLVVAARGVAMAVGAWVGVVMEAVVMVGGN